MPTLTPMHTLDLESCDGVTDVSALAGCATLREVYVPNMNVTGVSALTTAGIRTS